MKSKLSELSNLLLIIPFAYALYKPENNIDFIYDTGIMIFIAEFLSIHASGMVAGVSNTNNRLKVGLFFFYMIFVVTLLATTKSPQIFYFLAVSLVTKIFIHKGASAIDTFVKPFLVLISTAFVVILTSGLLQFLFPLTQEIISQKPSNISGLFVEVPQTVLVWGILYPIGLWLVSFIEFPKNFLTHTK